MSIIDWASIWLLLAALLLEALAAWCAHVPRAAAVFERTRTFVWGNTVGVSGPPPVPLWAWLWGKRRYNGWFGPRFPDAQWAVEESAPAFKGIARLTVGFTVWLRLVSGEPLLQWLGLS